MSLASGPGRGGGGTESLCVEAHIKYIQSLDTVCVAQLRATQVCPADIFFFLA